MKRLALLALAALLGLPAAPAHADLSPPRIAPSTRPRPKSPEVAAWIRLASAALDKRDLPGLEALCDPRAWKTNLAGPDGAILWRWFSHALERERRLAFSDVAPELLDHPTLGPGAGALVAVRLVSPGRVTGDLAYVLLVKGAGSSFLALGTSTRRPALVALAERWRTGAPLVPEPTP